MKRKAKALSLHERQNGVCAYCFNKMSLDINKPTSMTIEHIIPKSKGGTNEKNNLIAVCGSCNTNKGNTPIMEWK